MAKMPSYNFAQGQLFYSKTGRRVPEKYQKELIVDINKKGVYKNGRKVGSLKQKNLTKKAVATRTRSLKRIQKNINKGIYVPRVATVSHLLGTRPVGVDWVRLRQSLTGADLKHEQQAFQSQINFEHAISGLVDAKLMSESDAREWVQGYEQATDKARAEMWDVLRDYYDDIGVEY